MTDAERIAKLEEQLAEQAKVLEALKKAAEPKPAFVRQPVESYDWTANASMSPQMMREMSAAVGDSLVRQVVGDFRGGPAAPKSQAEGPPKAGAGWVEPRPLEPPPGQALIEEIADHFDRRDRAKGL